MCNGYVILSNCKWCIWVILGYFHLAMCIPFECIIIYLTKHPHILPNSTPLYVICHLLPNQNQSEHKEMHTNIFYMREPTYI